MVAPVSNVDICNLALDLLNTGPVADIDTPVTKLAVVCSRWYDSTRRQVLRKHVWNFAKARLVLSRDVTAPAFAYADAYNLPPDLVRLLVIGDDSTLNLKSIYEIEGRQLLINNSGAATLNIVYIKEFTEVTSFDALFTMVLAHTMAANMAFKITGKNTVVERLNGIVIDLLQEAASIDGQERPPRRIENSKLLSARRRRLTNTANSNIVFE